MRKKITISTYDSRYNPYYRGGGAMALHTLASKLQKKYDVTVIAGAYPRCQDGVSDGVKYEFIGSPWLGPKISQIFFHFFLIRRAIRSRTDVWLESFTPPWSTSFLPLFSRAPVIGIAHMLSACDMGRKYKLPFHLIEKIGVQFYRYCVVVSPFQVKVMRTLSPHTRVRLISNGIKVYKDSDTSTVPKKHQFLFLGRIEYDQKGIDILLRAFAIVTKQTPATLVIAGTGSPRDLQLMHELIDALGLRKHVRVVGYVQGERKTMLLKQSCALVMASRYETFGMSALEAFAHGTVVIVPNSEYFAWLPKKASYRFAPQDHRAMAATMRLVLKGNKARAHKEVVARAFASQYTWRSSTIAYERMIEQAYSASIRAEYVYSRGKIKHFLSLYWHAVWEYGRHLGLVFKNKFSFLIPRVKK